MKFKIDFKGSDSERIIERAHRACRLHLPQNGQWKTKILISGIFG